MKRNQDCLKVEEKFGGDKDRVMFAVFDGHGPEGDKCSRFVRDSMVDNVRNSPHYTKNTDKALSQAFVETNRQLHQQ